MSDTVVPSIESILADPADLVMQEMSEVLDAIYAYNNAFAARFHMHVYTWHIVEGFGLGSRDRCGTPSTDRDVPWSGTNRPRGYINLDGRRRRNCRRPGWNSRMERASEGERKEKLDAIFGLSIHLLWGLEQPECF